MSTIDFRPHRCGIILAGGDGKRLQPFIRKLMGVDLPKQYVSFLGTMSMLEQTYARMEQLMPPDRIFTVVARDHLGHKEVQRQLSPRPSHSIVVQPMNRETGPGLLLPLIHLCKHYPNSTVAVFPSDHFIFQEDLFINYARLAFNAVEKNPGKIVFLGVEPTDFEPEYGYILPDSEDSHSDSAVQNVKAFIEKPDPHIAAQVISSGALWNTMIMVFRPRIMLHFIGLSAPKLFHNFMRIYYALNTSRELSTIQEVYEKLEPVNFSKDLLEASCMHSRNRLSIIRMKGVFWSDWGSEHRIMSVLRKYGYLDRPSGEFQQDHIWNQLTLVSDARAEAIL